MANGAWQVQSSRATKFRTTKINSGGRVLFFTKICTPENYPLYGSLSVDIEQDPHIARGCRH